MKRYARSPLGSLWADPHGPWVKHEDAQAQISVLSAKCEVLSEALEELKARHKELRFIAAGANDAECWQYLQDNPEA